MKYFKPRYNALLFQASAGQASAGQETAAQETHGRPHAPGPSPRNTRFAMDPAELEALVDQQIKRVQDRTRFDGERDENLRRDVLAHVTGLGPLQPLMDDPSVEEIWINTPHDTFVARSGVTQRVELQLTDQQVRELVEKMLNSSGRRVDTSSPFVDASLPDGSRLHVTIPDITSAHWAVNIRKFSREMRSLAKLTESGAMSHLASEFLRMCVLARMNILVSGATQAGKTTLLNALLSAARSSERIITVEETFELNFDAGDVVAMQCRQPNLEGNGEVTLRRLIKEALRMRPDRIVVGEVRDAECLDLLIALNSGLPGSCSVHANTALDALAKLCTLPLLAGRNIDAQFIVPAVAASIDVIVHCELDRFGVRRVSEIVCPTGTITDGQLDTVTIFQVRDGELVTTGNVPPRLDKFDRSRLDPQHLLQMKVAS